MWIHKIAEYIICKDGNHANDHDLPDTARRMQDKQFPLEEQLQQLPDNDYIFEMS
jgi:hypothetical protein